VKYQKEHLSLPQKRRGGRGFSINNSRKYGNLRINAKKVPDFNRS
jgi:ribosomal protein L13E